MTLSEQGVTEDVQMTLIIGVCVVAAVAFTAGVIVGLVAL